MYYIIWKYIVPENKQEQFELEYGLTGTWAGLFSKSRHYLGSDLIKNTQFKTEYLLIDKWISEETYHQFIQNNQLEYSKHSEKFMSLYKSENKIGQFTSSNRIINSSMSK